MEEDLRILKVEYFSNNWSDLIQTGNLSLGDQTKLYSFFKQRQHSMEDDLNKLKFEYLGNHWSNLIQI